MHALASIFFEMSPNDANSARCFRLSFVGDVKKAVRTNREIELAYLVSLGEVWIEVLFAIPFRHWRDGAIDCKPSADRQVNGMLIHHGERAGKPEAYRAYLSIGRGTETRAATAKQLRSQMAATVILYY